KRVRGRASSRPSSSASRDVSAVIVAPSILRHGFEGSASRRNPQVGRRGVVNYAHGWQYGADGNGRLPSLAAGFEERPVLCVDQLAERPAVRQVDGPHAGSVLTQV